MSDIIKTQSSFAKKALHQPCKHRRMVTIVVGNDGKPGELETLMPGLGRGMVKHA